MTRRYGLGDAGWCLFGLACFVEHQGLRHQFPQILHFEVHHAILLAEALHDLVAAVVTGGDKEFGPRVLNLPHLDPAVMNTLLGVGHGPGAATGPAAEVVGSIRVHLHEVLHALLSDPARLLVVAVAEGALALPRVVARVVVGGELGMAGLIQLDAPGLDVFLEKVVNAQELDALILEPLLQTKPGRIVGVPSLR